MDHKTLIYAPIVLQSDNFTSLSRTPWAGNTIGQIYKKKILPHFAGKKIGESWEFSCDPEMPSYVEGTKISIPELLTQFPSEILSPALVQAQGHAFCEILVKLLNAAQPLSLQVHPYDHDPFLTKKECGKPETWLILHAEPHCGIYLGFSRALTKNSLKKALQEKQNIQELLQFVPVKSGDFFEIEPGVPHAIGPGVTLLEPQRILFGLSGKTYRMWDWNRKYNAKGEEDAQGKERELHLEECLRLINPEHQWGENFVKSLRRQPEKVALGKNGSVKIFPKNPYYQIFHLELAANSSCPIAVDNGYGILTFLEGSASLASRTIKKTVTIGQTLLLPHAAIPLSLNAQEKSCAVLIIPAKATVTFP